MRRAMTPSVNTSRFPLFLFVLLACFAPVVAAAGEADNQAEPGEATEERETRNFAGAILAFTDETGTPTAEFTYGVEYSYRVGRHWGVGALVEYTGSEQRNLVTVVPFYWFPHAGWVISGGPGLEHHKGGESEPAGLDETEDLFLLKVGIGYEFEVGRRLLIAPDLGLDIVDGGRQLLVYGVLFGIRW